MPYCRTEFKLVKPEQVENVLTIFTQECFVGGQVAYQLDDGSYSIDAGENDIRAIYDQENTEVKFFCRYQGKSVNARYLIKSAINQTVDLYQQAKVYSFRSLSVLFIINLRLKSIRDLALLPLPTRYELLR